MEHDNHLPALPSHGSWDTSFPFIDICDMDLPLEQLGQAIMSNYEAGQVAGKETINRLVTAGLLLIDAQSRDLNFEDFLRDHCNGLSRSWAYDLIAIACGKIEEVRAKAKARKLRYREKQAAARADARVRPGTDTKLSGCELSREVQLAAFIKYADAQLRKMDDEMRKRAVLFVKGWGKDDNQILDLPQSVP